MGRSAASLLLAFGLTAGCGNSTVSDDPQPQDLDATVLDVCETHEDCGPGYACGYPIDDGCDAVGECLRVGREDAGEGEGELVVFEPPGTVTPGLHHCPCEGWEGGFYVRALQEMLPDGATRSQFSHTDVPVNGFGLSCSM